MAQPVKRIENSLDLCQRVQIFQRIVAGDGVVEYRDVHEHPVSTTQTSPCIRRLAESTIRAINCV